MRRLRRGELLFRDLDLTLDYIQTQLVLDLLQCLPWTRRNGYRRNTVTRVARYRPLRVLRQVGVDPAATIGELTSAECRALREAVARGNPTQRD